MATTKRPGETKTMNEILKLYGPVVVAKMGEQAFMDVIPEEKDPILEGLASGDRRRRGEGRG